MNSRIQVKEQWQEKATVHHASRVNHASFSRDGHLLVTASYDNTTQIWGIVDGQWQKKATVRHTSWVNHASFSPEGKHLVTASDDKTAQIWELLADGQWQKKPPCSILILAVLKYAGRVKHASFSPAGDHLVTASDDRTAQIWGLVKGQWQKKPLYAMLAG